MDKIILENIKAYGSIGVYPEERKLGQWFSVDLTISKDLSSAALSDNLSDTVDYQKIIQQVQTKIKTSNCHLLENLAAEILSELFELTAIDSMTLKLTKLHAPISDFSGQVSIELTRDNPGKIDLNS